MVHKNERNKKLNVTKYVHVRAKLFEIQSDKRPDIRGLLPMPTSLWQLASVSIGTLSIFVVT